MDLKESEKKIDILKLKNEIADEELSYAQKQAAIKEAKKQLGPNWRKILGLGGKLKVNSETMHDLYSLGYGSLKDMNDPRKFRG